MNRNETGARIVELAQIRSAQQPTPSEIHPHTGYYKHNPHTTPTGYHCPDFLPIVPYIDRITCRIGHVSVKRYDTSIYIDAYKRPFVVRPRLFPDGAKTAYALYLTKEGFEHYANIQRLSDKVDG